jgi:hypothetical protein
LWKSKEETKVGGRESKIGKAYALKRTYETRGEIAVEVRVVKAEFLVVLSRGTR